MSVGGHEAANHNRDLSAVLLDLIRGNIDVAALRRFLRAQKHRGLPLDDTVTRLPDQELLVEAYQAIRAAPWLSSYHGEAKALFIASTEGQPREGRDSEYHGCYSAGFWLGGKDLRSKEVIEREREQRGR